MGDQRALHRSRLGERPGPVLWTLIKESSSPTSAYAAKYIPPLTEIVCPVMYALRASMTATSHSESYRGERLPSRSLSRDGARELHEACEHARPIGLPPSENLERGSRLIYRHATAVEGRAAPRARRAQQLGLDREIDDV